LAKYPQNDIKFISNEHIVQIYLNPANKAEYDYLVALEKWWNDKNITADGRIE
jgi:hypothetical protein